MYIKASKALVTQANRPAGGHLANKCHNGKIKNAYSLRNLQLTTGGCLELLRNC